MSNKQLDIFREKFPGAAGLIEFLEHEEVRVVWDALRAERRPVLDAAKVLWTQGRESVRTNPAANRLALVIDQFGSPDFLRYVAAKLGLSVPNADERRTWEKKSQPIGSIEIKDMTGKVVWPPPSGESSKFVGGDDEAEAALKLMRESKPKGGSS